MVESSRVAEILHETQRHTPGRRGSGEMTNLLYFFFIVARFFVPPRIIISSRGSPEGVGQTSPDGTRRTAPPQKKERERESETPGRSHARAHTHTCTELNHFLIFVYCLIYMSIVPFVLFIFASTDVCLFLSTFFFPFFLPMSLRLGPFLPCHAMVVAVAARGRRSGRSREESERSLTHGIGAMALTVSFKKFYNSHVHMRSPPHPGNTLRLAV